MSDCKHEMGEIEAWMDGCHLCGENEFDIAKALITELRAENERLREAARYTVNAWNAGNFDGTDDGIEALASTLRDIEGGEKGR